MTGFNNLLDPALIILIIIFSGLSFFFYRISNPPLPKWIKVIQIFIRAAALILLAAAIFNATITFNSGGSHLNRHLFFIDNSKSISFKDSLKRSEAVNKFIASFSGSGKNLFYTFGTKTDSLKGKSVPLNEPYTNFEGILKFISDQDDYSPVVIVSDGIITDGSNPLYGFGKQSMPVFTVGIGDTSLQKDLSLTLPGSAAPMYKNRTGVIETGVISSNLAGKEATVTLSESGKIIGEKKITLSQSGIDNISFGYTPKVEGENILSLSVTPLPDEINKKNNTKLFSVNVINDKIKVFLISGSPSPDAASISTILSADERIKLKFLTELNGGRQITGGNSAFPADSSSVFILLNYPDQNSDGLLFKRVKDLIIQKKTPVMFITGNGTDFTRLNELSAQLPFTTGIRSAEEFQVEVYSDALYSPVVSSSDALLWESLPPVLQTKTEFIPKSESEIILKYKVKNSRTNMPASLLYQNNNSRSIAITCSGIWKWKLQSVEKNERLFDKFLINSIQWLNTPGQKKLFTLKTGKKIYSMGERIEVTGILTDELSNPVENASIVLKVKGEAGSYNLQMENGGNGLYKGQLGNSIPGNLKISGNVRIGNKVLSDSLNLVIEKTELEYLNTQMNLNFLKQIASVTGGSYYSIDNYTGLAEKLGKTEHSGPLKPQKISEFRFASNEIILIILVLLFSLEWTIRKFYRLL